MTMKTIRTSLTTYRSGRMLGPVFAFLASLLLIAGSASAGTSAKARILGLKTSTAKSTTTLRIQGSSRPTFTVYKLENPSRVVVDVVGTTLSAKLLKNESKVIWNVNSWAVGQVSAHTISKARGDTVRVVVGLSRPSRYTVRALGNDVLVEVVAKTAAPKSPVGGMDAVALKRAQLANSTARKAAVAELASARAEAQRIRSQAALRDQEAKSRLAQAQQLMALAKVQSADAQKASRLAKSERTSADKRRARAQDAETRAQASQAALKKAEQAALLATSRANKAQASNASNRKALQARAQVAVRAADKRRAEAERASKLANQRRVDSERARKLADKQRLAAASALEHAQAERLRAEVSRDRALAMGGAAKSKQKNAERAARAAAKRAKELQSLVRAEESRLAAATALRKQEESATKEATIARQRAEQHRERAVAAETKLSSQIQRLVRAKQDAKRSRILAEKALAKAQRAAADNTVSRAERTRLLSEAKNLKSTRQQAESALATQELNIQARRKEVALLKGKRQAAIRGLSSLQRKADKVRALRSSEEAKLAALSSKRAKVGAQLEAAKNLRLVARAELADARQARMQAQALRQRAEKEQRLAETQRKMAQTQQRIAREHQERAAQDRQAAKLARDEAARSRAAAKNERLEASELAVAAQRSKKEAESQRLAAQKARVAAGLSRQEAESQRLAAQKARVAAGLSRQEAESQRLAAQEAHEAAGLSRQEAEAQRLAATKANMAAARSRREADSQRLAAREAHEAAGLSRQEAEAQRLAATKANMAAARSRQEADSKRLAANEFAMAAEKSRNRALKAESQILQELELAKRARLAAESVRKNSSQDMRAAKKLEMTAERRLKESQLARQRAQSDRKAGTAAIKTSKAHESAALAALQEARAERKLAEQARAKGEAALQLASLREQQAAKKLALAVGATPASRPLRTSRTRLSDLDVVQSQGVTRVVIAMSSPAKPKVVRNRGNEAVLEIPYAGIRDEQERTLDTSSLRGVVKAVSSYRDPKNPNTLKIVVNLNSPTKGVLKKVGNTYYWEFPLAKKVAPKVALREKPSRGVTTTSYQTQAVAGYGSTSSPITQQTVAQARPHRRKIYRGQKMDLNVKNNDIHDLLRMLADVGGVNIIVPDSVKARVTIRLRRVPWDQAMDVILASKGLGYKLEGPGLYRIAQLKELEAEFKAKVARARARAASESPESEILNLNYVDAAVLKTQLKSMLSRKGDLQVDVRSNALIINDIKSKRAAIIDMAKKLDTETPQIQIEARIVEARSTYTKQFGIQWGGNMTASSATGNATGLIFPSSIGLAGAAEDGQTPNSGVGASPSDFAINLPAAIGTGSGGGIGLSLGSVGGALGLNLRLSALEDEGSVRLVSSPKITTSNNIQASIKSGVSIPVSVVSANGVQTQFVPADLELRVKPSVSLRDCAVSMEINVSKNEADFVNTGARGDPSLLTKEAKTTVLVQDGETSVIGGIYTRNSGVSYSKVPFFGDLPVIGWLFKTTRENDERTEVLIFITPKITNRGALPCHEL